MKKDLFCRFRYILSFPKNYGGPGNETGVTIVDARYPVYVRFVCPRLLRMERKDFRVHQQPLICGTICIRHHGPGDEHIMENDIGRGAWRL